MSDWTLARSRLDAAGAVAAFPLLPPDHRPPRLLDRLSGSSGTSETPHNGGILPPAVSPPQ